MVDAMGVNLRKSNLPTGCQVIFATGADTVRFHTELCNGLCPAPAQHPVWVANWMAHSDVEAILAVLTQENGSPLLSLPLEIVTSGAVKTARYLSGSHANGNFPAIRPGTAPIDPSIVSSLASEFATMRPDIDLLLLERQARFSNGVENPFLALPHFDSPNPALALSLDGGFDGVLERSSGKRKRKKHRSQLRKFETIGGWRRFRAENEAEVNSLLDAFLAMKAERFRQMGIRDKFAEAGVQRSFRNMFLEAAGMASPPFALHGLEVGSKLRAVTGSSICAERIVCEFSAFADDDISHTSPGDFLFYENIREACELGLSIYDFSVGDEAYKRQWCDRTEIQFDCSIPLTAKGKLAALAMRTASSAKRAVKSNDGLWKAAKKIRQTVSGG